MHFVSLKKKMKTPGFVILILLFTACSDSKDSAEKHIEKKLEKKVREIVVPQGENKGVAKLTIEGMSCEVNCANKIQETISNLSGVLSCTVDFENKLANVEFDPLDQR